MLISCDKIQNKKKSALPKESSGFTFIVYDSVSRIKKEHWNTVASYGSEFLNFPFLTVLENQRPDNMHFHYAIIYDKAKPVAIAYFQVIDFSSESFGDFLEKDNSDYSCIVTDYITNHITNHIIKTADRINLRLLICGNACISGEHGFTCIPETDKTKAIDALAAVIHSISKAEKTRGKIAAVLVKDFYTSSLNVMKEFEEFKYHDFLVEPNMMIPIHWKTFQEYQNAMSKKYRNRAKNVVKKGTDIERRYFSEEDILANSNEIQHLYNNVHLKAKFRMAALTSSYFAEMKKVMGNKFSFTAYYYHQKLVGFKTTFILKEENEAHFIGLDYSLNREIDIYQNILYDYVKEAIENGSKRLLLGRTASEIKSTVGAEALELTCYIRHRNPLSNRIIKPFVDYFRPSDWTPRNPFKEINS